ncbi:MAG TPA: VOC family protein [Panacibacter sp.]|nr:VOC family protein [Panacibacter sp.]
MKEAVNFTINSIQHIGIPVTDIKLSLGFYERLGFGNSMQSSFIHKGKTGTCIMMQRGKMIIELYQMPEPELVEIRNRKDGHIDHVAFDVDDIDDAFYQLQKQGFTVLEPAPVFLPFWKNGCKYFNISGPDGERLEFNQIL